MLNAAPLNETAIQGRCKHEVYGPRPTTLIHISNIYLHEQSPRGKDNGWKGKTEKLVTKPGFSSAIWQLGSYSETAQR